MKRRMSRESWELVCWAVLLGVVLTIFVGLWTGALG